MLELRHFNLRTNAEYTVLDKDKIKKGIMSYLRVAKREFVSQGCLIEVANAILHKLQSGCQWLQLPVRHLFSDVVQSWKAVFHHFRKWCRLGEWQYMFAARIKRYRNRLDMSITHLDGSHTPARRSGENVEYQGRKKRKTTNSLYFCDRHGLTLAMFESQKGNHTDLYEIGSRIDEIASQLKECRRCTDGIFNNADAGFDAKSFRHALEKHEMSANVCPNPRNGEPAEDYLFDEDLYKERFLIERSNAWMDGFRSILTRFDTIISSLKGWNYLAFTGISLKKIHKSQKFKITKV